MHSGCRVHLPLLRQWLLLTESLKCCDELYSFFKTTEHISHIVKHSGMYA